jgi:predicted nucleic acid-binding protein
MAEVVLDANVIVALLYAADTHHQRAHALVDRLEREQHTVVLVDFLVFEALSVLCRRATERKTSPPDLQAAITLIRGWFEGSEFDSWHGKPNGSPVKCSTSSRRAAVR